jgi:murein L,D-transpeptidase YcbB/YkuD
MSAEMTSIVFNPEWPVAPGSAAGLIEKLRGGGGLFGQSSAEILAQYKVTVKYNGKPVDASKIDWKRIDAQAISFVRQSGPDNIFGKVRFVYPNNRGISLYEAKGDSPNKVIRAEGAASPRVDNPEKLAALLLTEDENPAAKTVEKLLKDDNETVTLQHKLPVHTVYFTAVVDDAGKLQTFPDIYKLDELTTAALAAKPKAGATPVAAVPAKPKPEASAAKAKPSTVGQAAQKPKAEAVGQATPERRGFGASAPD